MAASGEPVRAIFLDAFCVEIQRVFPDRESALDRNPGLPLFDFGIEKLFDATAIDADQMIVVVTLVHSNTALPDSKWWRVSNPACSNCVNTR